MYITINPVSTKLACKYPKNIKMNEHNLYLNIPTYTMFIVPYIHLTCIQTYRNSAWLYDELYTVINT